MTIFSIVRANLRQRSLSSTLTASLVAVGVALVCAILLIRTSVEEGLADGRAGKLHLVVGPKGSGLQLVLHAVYHLGKPTGTIPFSLYDDLRIDPRVRLAVPVATGDNVAGFQLVGTAPHFLRDFHVRENETLRLKEGRAFEKDGEVVLGSEAARKTGLRVGEEFYATHGVRESEREEERHREGHLTVVGILAPTETPHDRAIYTTLETVWGLHPNLASLPANRKPLSGVYITMHSDAHIAGFAGALNSGKEAMAAFPSVEIRDLMSVIGHLDTVLLAISWLVLLSAGVSIMVSIYNSIAERRREIAILRAVGSPRSTVLGMILIESMALCAIGAFGGLALSHAGVAFGERPLRDLTGIYIAWSGLGLRDAVLFVGTLGIGALAGLLPALAAYRTDVASHLRPIS